MIYTVTLNPSIDYIAEVPSFKLGSLNRMTRDLKLPGGKGINVSRVLKQLGHHSVALGFLGGFTGEFIQDWLIKEKVDTHFTVIKEDTRINVKLKSNQETEINAIGPVISVNEAAKFLKEIEKISSTDVVILSGNQPESLPKNFYKRIILAIKSTGAEFVMDTTGQTLLDSLAFSPILVKPNHHELAEMFNVSFQSVEEMVPYGKKLIELGATYALISMAGDGALFFSAKEVYQSNVPKGIVKNSVGAGDSMVAGFIGTLLKEKNPLLAFKTSVATGSATAFSDDLAKKDEVEQLISQVSIHLIHTI
ncbi:fructose-1-phosphate kinase [Carnobacterium iners]|uniref:Tagatose-6-phosphate kinase n=1 Tax=Carnobacterium iners TaxID=1073423 RepID=A0A1X7NHL3_9LACT|nr:1-phosphofructokinase [Carnobacterium iners]SEK64245.1 fructose-1-phosphate kinase [Carnobacterium iners]SMH37258.1 fructose-1-phosphate kinase [Carnobacterium iners]